jgi:hypothetical protein
MPVYIITSQWEKEIAIEADYDWQAMDIAEDLLKQERRPIPTPSGCVYYRESSSFPFHDTVVFQLLQCPYCGNNFQLRLGGTIMGCFVRCRSCQRESRWERLAKDRDCSLCTKSLNCLSIASVNENPNI